MKITSKTYPADIIICMVWSVILVPLVLLDIDNTLRIIFGLPFILFIPGYTLVFTLFPAKTTIDVIERIALSFGLSIAIVPLIGLGLNYTVFGIRLEPILFSTFIFILGIGAIGLYRWFKTPTSERFIVDLDISFPKSDTRLDKALTIILVAVIIIAVAFLIYVIVTPRIGERFTEFYLLGPQGNASGYPSNLSKGENASVIIGIANHEYKTINYTVEVWLVNQTTNEDNETLYHNLWFMDTINTTVNHTPIDVEEPWTAQWEYNYSFSINRSGRFKLAFLLYTQATEEYDRDTDYKELAPTKIDTTNTTAYRTLHLWINTNKS